MIVSNVFLNSRLECLRFNFTQSNSRLDQYTTQQYHVTLAKRQYLCIKPIKPRTSSHRAVRCGAARRRLVYGLTEISRQCLPIAIDRFDVDVASDIARAADAGKSETRAVTAATAAQRQSRSM